ncbi:MAG TPA: alpha/beta hydrolase [Rhizomicrobium sp.]|nr:alpha/beta hydrolase [Rhizomicrobium sp.]
MAQFSSGGVTLAYDDIGPKDRGRPIILIHGFASNRNENWRRVGWYGAFERKGIRFVAFDVRGHGESDKPHDPAMYTREALARDVFNLMDHAGIERADVFGYSMGARVAMAAALMEPSRVDLLIVGGVGERMFTPSSVGNPIALAMEADDPASISEPILRSFRQFADEQGEDRLALAAFARAVNPPLTREIVSCIARQTLVVAGARDVLAGDPSALAEFIPDAKSVTLPGCDHFSAISHALTKAAVFDFLDGTLE